MIKKACAGAIICGAFFAWASNSSITEVDAVSQATVHINMKFTLPIAVTSNSTTISWTQTKRKGQGSGVLSYGTSTSTLVNKTVTNAERDAQKIELTGLASKTTYSIRLEFTDPNNPNHKPFADTATITTLPGTSVTCPFALKKDMPLELLDHSVRLGSAAQSNDRVTMADCEGRTLFDHSVKGNERSIALPSNAKGVYFLIYRRQGTVLDKKQLFIIH